MATISGLGYTYRMTILLIHIGIALSSLIASSINALLPRRALLHVSYALMAGTFASGTLLVLQDTTHLQAACMSGLVYFALVGALTAFAHRKLAYEKAQ